MRMIERLRDKTRAMLILTDQSPMTVSIDGMFDADTGESVYLRWEHRITKIGRKYVTVDNDGGEIRIDLETGKDWTIVFRGEGIEYQWNDYGSYIGSE